MALTTKLAHLLMLNYPVPAGKIAGHIPGPLELDSYDGSAWVSVLAFQHLDFAMFGPVGPKVSFPQINYRTYVKWHGERGVYFFRADQANFWLPRVSWLLFGMPWRASAIELSAEFDVEKNTYKSWHVRSPDFEAAASSGRGKIANGEWFQDPVRGFFTHWDGAVRRFKVRRTAAQPIPAEVNVTQADFLTKLGLPDINKPRSAWFIPSMQFEFAEFPPEFA